MEKTFENYLNESIKRIIRLKRSESHIESQLETATGKHKKELSINLQKTIDCRLTLESLLNNFYSWTEIDLFTKI
jgi:hypothetical protein